MNGYMIAGFITGLVLAVILVKIAFRFIKKDKNEKFRYDERQKAVRGEAYKYAFFTLAVYNAVYGILDMILDKPWAETMTGVMIGVCLAVLVHISYSIWKGSYFSMNENPGRLIIFLVVIAVMNGAIGLKQGLEGELIESGMLTNNCANLVVAVMLVIVLAVMGFKAIAVKREAEEE